MEQKRDELEYWLSEHLRLSGIYWGLTCLDLLDSRNVLDQTEVIDFVKKCQCADGMILMQVSRVSR